jgi:predicted nucleotide-binding protein (sugar kinase/HSP70/actin superfamily)
VRYDELAKMKFAFYQVGNSVIATNAFARKIGIDVVELPSPTRETIEKGVSFSPEFSCFPFKVLLGMLMQGIERGAGVFIVPYGKSVSACQLADFGMAQKYILKRIGREFDIILLDGINPKTVLEKFRLHKEDITLPQVYEGLIVAAQKLVLLESVEDRSRDIYLAERKRNAEAFRARWTMEIDRTDAILDLYALGREMEAEHDRHPKVDYETVLKIAVIGDIYSINEKIINNDIFERLCDLNVYPENGVRLRTLFDTRIGFDPEDWMLSRTTRKYLRHNIGGFSVDTVKSAIRYAGKRFDGLIHIYPFSCMPEVVVRNILPSIGNDYDIPILYLPIDEQTGDAGFNTRVEAFVDLVEIRKRRAGRSANG